MCVLFLIVVIFIDCLGDLQYDFFDVVVCFYLCMGVGGMIQWEFLIYYWCDFVCFDQGLNMVVQVVGNMCFGQIVLGLQGGIGKG